MLGLTRFENEVLSDIREGGLLDAGDGVVVGVSGGADSMALLTVLRRLDEAGELPVRLAVAHLNHGWRGAASDDDAAFVRAHAREYSLPFFVEEAVELRGVTSNLEKRAREARRDFFARVARDTSAAAIALGHTADDQAETMLLRLGQGTGVAGLAAMAPRREDGVIRPLLRRRRKDGVAYLDELSVPFVNDASNADPRFTRNRIRHEGLPALCSSLGVDVAERLATLALDLRIESGLAQQWIRGVLDAQPTESLQVSAVRGAGRGAGRLVHAWLTERGAHPSRAHVAAVVALTGQKSPSAGVDLPGVRVERRYELLCLRPAAVGEIPGAMRTRGWALPGRLTLETGWRLSAERTANPGCEPADAYGGVVDARGLRGDIVVRAALPGDRVRLRGGRRKLSDVFIDARLPRRERAGQVVVASDVEVLWVPGLAIAESLRPGPGTRRWFRLRAQRL